MRTFLKELSSLLFGNRIVLLQTIIVAYLSVGAAHNFTFLSTLAVAKTVTRLSPVEIYKNCLGQISGVFSEPSQKLPALGSWLAKLSNTKYLTTGSK